MENAFQYTYSPKENQEVLNIRKKYLPHTESTLEKLKRLDSEVKTPVNVFAYVYGSISAIIMGAGMSLVMTNMGSTLGIANPMIPGIAIGVVGMVLALTTHPIYKAMLNSRKKKYAPQILQLSENIIKG